MTSAERAAERIAARVFMSRETQISVQNIIAEEELAELASLRSQLEACQRERDEARKAIERIPDYWKDAIGESYKPVKLGKLQASHPTTVKKALAEVSGTELADVIAALAFQACIAWEAQGLLGEQVTEEQQKRATAEQQLSEARDDNGAWVAEIIKLQQQLQQMK